MTRFAILLTLLASLTLMIFASDAKISRPMSSNLISGSHEELLSACRADIAWTKSEIEKLKTTNKPAPASALAAFDTAVLRLSDVLSRSGLAEQALPAKEGRDAAQKCTQEASQYLTELQLDRGLFDVIASIDSSKLDAAGKHFHQTTLRDFRRAGVDKDATTRARITALNEELVKISQEFSENIAADVRKVEFDPAELAGLPDDFMKRHAAGANGKITLTTDNTDYFPFMQYAENMPARERYFRAYMNRAYPKNLEVINRMLQRRYELANLLGYPDWASYNTADKMVGSSKNVSDFIDKITAAASNRAKQDYDELLAYKKKFEPSATQIMEWEAGFLRTKLGREKYSFDAREARPYFEYTRVKQALLDLTTKMYGISYQPVKDAKVWHPDVEVYDVMSGKEKLGRIYLDLFPRENKYKHYANFGLQSGKLGVQLPESVLVCNFPKPEGGAPALMEYRDVITFFHEYGHLLHAIFSGHTGYPTGSLEWDFIEAPSQMFEEWARDPKILQTFALHYKTNQPIPVDMVKAMRRAEEFGKGLDVRRQMLLAATSLGYHNRTPEGLDTDKLSAELQTKYVFYPKTPETHFQTAFGHIDSYSSNYYTYMWSLVIAKDMYSVFNKGGLMSPELAKKYRDEVLAPGSTKPAGDLVRNFLGREYAFKAYEEWLNSQP
jgi:thimet oligopeptidase